METERCDHPCPPFAIACIAVAKVQGSIHAVRHAVAALLAGWRASSTSTAQLHVLRDPLTYIRGMPSGCFGVCCCYGRESTRAEDCTALLLFLLHTTFNAYGLGTVKHNSKLWLGNKLKKRLNNNAIVSP